MADQNRRRYMKGERSIGLLPKGLWVVKPMLLVAGVFLVIDIMFLSTLETSYSNRLLHLSVGNPFSGSVEPEPGIKDTTKRPFQFDRRQSEAILAKLGPAQFRVPITAYLEPPLQDMVFGSINQGDPDNTTDIGTPPRFIEPLPTRNHHPDRLKKVVYSKFQTCHDLTSKLPVDRGLIIGNDGNVVVWNTATSPDQNHDDSQYCPVDQDPHLPWIHDIIPSSDGSVIHFVAQNKRRCHTGENFRMLVQHMAPQVSLFQPVSVKRLTYEEAILLAPQVYHDGVDEVRYRLADYNEADDDGQQTRFRCRFTTNTGNYQTKFIGETLSVYPFNYEFVSWRRALGSMLNPRGTDQPNIYISTLMFDCPVPTNLQSLVASGDSVLSDGTPTLHVDLIPIRTSPRYGMDEVYFNEALAGPKGSWHLGFINSTSNSTLGVWRELAEPLKGFDAKNRWGTRHVLPPTSASGRWTNLPICKPSSMRDKNNDDDDENESIAQENQTSGKPFELVACVWASASYATRGANVQPSTSSLDRISEWLEFALLVGFDHIYVYDNSAANHPTLNLKEATDRFAGKVDRIPWDYVACNNNQPGAPSPGERSSQYAAENSCRIRFGNLTTWMASFDLDELLIPMGSYDSLKQVTRDAAAKGHKILDFRSTLSKLRLDASEPINAKGHSNRKKANVPFLEAYNCDTVPPPKPETAERAHKEIYRTDHVLYHFVHYSLVTKTTATFYKDRDSSWVYSDIDEPVHVVDEVNEAVMLHGRFAKEHQQPWKRFCRTLDKSQSCKIGIPWPRGMNWTEHEGAKDSDGNYYNCHENTKVADYWVPKLKKAMLERDLFSP